MTMKKEGHNSAVHLMLDAAIRVNPQSQEQIAIRSGLTLEQVKANWIYYERALDSMGAG